jgi:hypothetical protein
MLLPVPIQSSKPHHQYVDLLHRWPHSYLFLKSSITITPAESLTNASMPSFTGAPGSFDSRVMISSFLLDIEILIPYKGCSQFEHFPLRWHCIQQHNLHPPLSLIKRSLSGRHFRLYHSILTIPFSIYLLHSKIQPHIPTLRQQSRRSLRSSNALYFGKIPSSAVLVEEIEYYSHTVILRPWDYDVGLRDNLTID